MSAVESRPYASPSYRAVSADVRLVSPSVSFALLADNWEPGTDLVFRMGARLGEQFWAQTKIPPSETVFLVGTVFCPSLRTRWPQNANFVGDGVDKQAELTIEVPGKEAAGELRYELWVVGNGRIGESGYGGPPPIHPGAKLWELKGQRSLLLESTGNSFPTSALSFNRTGRPQIPWSVEILEDAEPEWNLHGCVRIYVNTDLGVHTKILDDTASGDLYAQMEADIYFSAIHCLANSPGASDGDEIEDLAGKDPKTLAALGLAGSEKLGISFSRALDLACENPMSLILGFREAFGIFREGSA